MMAGLWASSTFCCDREAVSSPSAAEDFVLSWVFLNFNFALGCGRSDVDVFAANQVAVDCCLDQI